MTKPDTQRLFQAAVEHLRAGRPAAALPLLHQTIATDPSVPEPFFLIGLIFQQQQLLPQAIAAYRDFLSRKPNDGKGLNNLGRALLDLGQVNEAMQTLQQAVVASPQNAGAFSNLGEAFRMSGNADAAIAHYRNAIAVDANCGEAYCNMGIVLAKKGRGLQAVACFEKAVAINPKSFSARFNLARMLQDTNRFDPAVEQCRAAIEIRPESGEAHNVLGNLLGIMGEVEQCIASQRQAVQFQPDHTANHSNLLLTLQYRDDLTISERLAAHRQWEQQHIAKLTPFDSIRNNCDKNRRLRIGYVSPNFQAHSVSYFFEPVLAAHDRAEFEVFCYSNTKNPDAATARFHALTDHWRDISMMSDLDAAKLIQQDQVDILVDLAGHTAGNRLPVFGYKPAPIQMTWIGYPDTTGMTAIDYRLTDAIADPPGESDAMHTEKLLRIPGSCWAYTGPGNAPPTSPPPSITNGYITFGSFNNLPKVSPAVLETWANILHQVPRSRLAMKAAGLRGQMGRDFVLRHLANFGITPDRVDLLGWAPTTASHLDLYSRIDIALDTFPYNGTTTTCEALWMGVPVVTFPGNRHVARVGASLLTHANCGEWITKDLDGYIKKAAQLAGDVASLSAMRGSLRERLQSSPLCDAGRVAIALEKIYQDAWRSFAS
jgi:predicted O-linked N-acetylglucosamine transferase (SPINDLY family)